MRKSWQVEMPDPISFVTRLTDAEWDEVIGGWRCAPLRIPGARVQGLYVEGSQVDSGNYQILQSQDIIRWVLPQRPQRIAVVVELSEALALEADADKWRRRAIVLPFLATIGAALITAIPAYLSKLDFIQGRQRPESITARTASPSVQATQSKFADDNRIPAWIPRYPGTNIENLSFQGRVGSYSFKCPDSTSTVLEFFDSRFRLQGLHPRKQLFPEEMTVSNNDELQFVLKQTSQEKKDTGWYYRYDANFIVGDH